MENRSTQQPELPLEIRWHGRGGQGVVTASRILATAALNGGYYLQSLPDFGAERSGAPISAYTRISETPPVDRGPITEPDAVILLDASLIGQVNILGGLVSDGTVVINVTDANTGALEKLQARPEQQLWTVDGSAIGAELLGRNLPNTPVLGAFARAVPVLGLEAISEALKQLMSETFSAAIIESNLKALRRGYDEAVHAEVRSHV